MSIRSLLSTLAAGAALSILGVATTPAQAGSLGVNINLNGYLPAPPGVHIYYDSGRPYYVENHQRVYLKKEKEHHEKEHHDNGKKKGHKKHHKD
ncbi:hypothetical protein [Geomonas subterranea]|uniref:hypothetical protein n=1 Tax=Geomonas subterranea TaxID=2847989 RepID=UPI001CD53D51|nr:MULTISPECIES: hypothetical protein [Geomonas]